MSGEATISPRGRAFPWRAVWPWAVFVSAVLVGFSLDWPVYRAVPDLPNPPLAVAIVGVIHRYGTQTLYFIISIPLMLAAGYALKDYRAVFTGWAGCVAAAFTASLTQLLKHTTGRARPAAITHETATPGFHGPATANSFHSFPSGDAAAAFCFAYIIGHYSPTLRWPLYVLAGLIALGRVLMEAHFASDIIAGAGVGTLAGWVGVQVADIVRQRRTSRADPPAAG